MNWKRKIATTIVVWKQISFEIKIFPLRIILNWFKIEIFAAYCMKIEIPGLPILQIARIWTEIGRLELQQNF